MTKTNQANDKAMLDIFKGKQRENTPERRYFNKETKLPIVKCKVLSYIRCA